MIKPVDAESFQKRKDPQEGGDKKNDSFDIEIIEEGSLEKALNAEKKTPYGKPPSGLFWGNINDYFDETKVKYPKEFLMKCKSEFNVCQLIPYNDMKRDSTSWSWIWIVFTNCEY